MRIVRGLAAAIAIAALAMAVPLPACAAAARAQPPVGVGNPRYPYAHLVPGLVVHPSRKPMRRVVVAAPVRHGFMPHGPQMLLAPSFALDGDTFDSGGVRYRLYGIDTPELREPLGPQARVRLRQLLAMGPVSVIPVAVDVYGRQVAKVMAAGLNVAAVLRAEGFAKP